MEAIRSSEALVRTRATRRFIPEDDILHSYRRENLKPYLDQVLSSDEGRKTPTLLGPLERANLGRSMVE
jgi:hypothetical protein